MHFCRQTRFAFLTQKATLARGRLCMPMSSRLTPRPSTDLVQDTKQKSRPVFCQQLALQNFGHDPKHAPPGGHRKGGSLYMPAPINSAVIYGERRAKLGESRSVWGKFRHAITVVLAPGSEHFRGLRGRTDDVIQRFVEFVSAFPSLPLLMSLASLVPKTADSLIVFLIMALILALLNWTKLAREVRGKVLALRSTDFGLADKRDGRLRLAHYLQTLAAKHA